MAAASPDGVLSQGPRPLTSPLFSPFQALSAPASRHRLRMTRSFCRSFIRASGGLQHSLPPLQGQRPQPIWSNGLRVGQDRLQHSSGAISFSTLSRPSCLRLAMPGHARPSGPCKNLAWLSVVMVPGRQMRSQAKSNLSTGCVRERKKIEKEVNSTWSRVEAAHPSNQTCG